jgi:hypothetical protein
MLYTVICNGMRKEVESIWWDQGGECWIDLSTNGPNGPLGPWLASGLGTPSLLEGWWAPVAERILISPRGGWIGESWKSPLKTNLSVKPGYFGLFSGVSGKSGISGKISGVSGLAPSQRNEHTAQNCANPVPPGLPGSDSPLLLLLVCLFGLNLNLMNSLRISYLKNMECLHFTNTNNQVAPPIWQRQARKDMKVDAR